MWNFFISLEFSNHASIKGSIPKPMKRIIALFFSTVAIAFGQPLVSVETVAVGNAGNTSDTTGFGAVPYEFLIGKYEVTINQYAVFLNTVAAVEPASYLASLWHPAMQTDLNVAGIARSGAGTIADPYSYQVIGSGNRPIAYVSWFDAARFANWVNNGALADSSTEVGAYTLNGQSTGNAPARNAVASWWIPTENEWYKAAYYKGGGTNSGYWAYPTKSDTAPGNEIGGESNQANYAPGGSFAVTQSSTYSATQNYLTDVGVFSNSASAYETFDQGGNLYEWNDLDGGAGPSRGLRGGDWSYDERGPRSSGRSFEDIPDGGGNIIGFRLAAVPEPSTFALLIAGLAAVLIVRLRRKA